MIKNRREKKLEALARELFDMAKEYALQNGDEILADLMAQKLLNGFSEENIRARAVEYCMLYGTPKTDREKTKLMEYSLGEPYITDLISDPERTRQRFEEYLDHVEIKISRMTIESDEVRS